MSDAGSLSLLSCLNLIHDPNCHVCRAMYFSLIIGQCLSGISDAAAATVTLDSGCDIVLKVCVVNTECYLEDPS